MPSNRLDVWQAKLIELESDFLSYPDEAPVEVYWKLVQASRNCNNFVKADEYALEGLNIYPDHPVLVSEWAWNAQVTKDWSNAVLRLEKLCNILVGRISEKIYIRLSDSYIKNDQMNKSEKLIRLGIKDNPNYLRLIKYKENQSFQKANNDSLDANNNSVLLTTFPLHASKNVGDQLITHSTIRMIEALKVKFSPIIEFRATSLDKYVDGSVKAIIAPGFSISDGTYPNLFGLYSNLERLPNFFPIGCSFQHITPSLQTFLDYDYSQETLAFLQLITDKFGPLPCRDQLIVDMLLRHNIPSVYSGDMAIYDERYLNTPFIAPKQIKSLVFTIQHHERYQTQSYVLLSLIKDRFPEAKLYVAFHSKVGPKPQKIADYAVSLGFEELHLYGDVKNLDVYDAIDFHVGYRLHGHISFLRRRKPSILLVEDARSFGFAQTRGTHVGCVDAWSVEYSVADTLAPLKAVKLIDELLKSNFAEYKVVFDFVDKNYNDFVLPFFQKVSEKL